MAITVGQLLVRLGMDLSEFSKGLQDAQHELRKQGDMFKNAGETFTKAFTLPLGGLGVAATAAFAGFEQAMNKVLALGGKDVADMFGDLQSLALKLGADTKYSARQAAEAMGELAASGFKANEIMAAMPGLLSLAATENMKLADAARISSSILRGFGIDATKMQEVADILAKTAAMSSVSIQDLGYSFQYIGPAARAAGQSFMDVSAALAVLGNAGIRGESAGTALRNMFNDLMTPTKAVAGALDALKIKTTDVYGKLLPMGDLIKNLTPLTNNMALGFKLFGQRFSDIIPLIADGGAAFRDAQKEIKEFTGAADAMAKTMQKGISGNLEKFTGNLETLAISVGKLLAPAVNLLIEYGNKVIDMVQAMVNRFAQLPTGVQVAVLAFAALAASIGPVLYVLGTMAEGIGNLKLLAPVLSGVGGALKTFGLDLGSITGKISEFVRSLASMTIGSAAGGLSSFLTNFGKSIKDTFAAIPSQLSAAKASLVQFGATLASAVANNAKAAWTALATFTGEVVKMAKALKDINVAKSLGAITDAVSGFAANMKNKGLTGLWDDFILGAGKLSGVVSGGFAASMSSLMSMLSGLASNLGVGAAAFGAIAAAATAAAVIIVRDWEDVKRTFNAFTTDLENDTTGLRQKLVDMWISLSGGPFIAAVITAFRITGQSFKDLWNTIVTTYNAGVQTLANMASGLAAKLGFEETAKALRQWGTEVEMVTAKVNEMNRIKVPVANDAISAMKHLNELVAQYSGEVRLGTKSWEQTQPLLNNVGTAIKAAQVQYAKLKQDLKMGLITKETFAEQTAALDAAVASASSFAGQMSAKFGAAGINVDQFGKTTKNMASEFDKHMKAVSKSADVVKDVLEDLPNTWEKFTQMMTRGNFNPAKTIDSLHERIRDLTRQWHAEHFPQVKAGLSDQIKLLRLAAEEVEAYDRKWRDNQIVEEAEKIADKLRDMQFDEVKESFEKAFKGDAMLGMLSGLDAMQHEFEEVQSAAQLLGVILDETAIKTKGQFTGVSLNMLDAIRLYEKLTRTAGVTTTQLRDAWVGMEKRKLEASLYAFDQMTIANDGFMNVVKAAWKIGVQEFGIAVVEGMKKAQAIMTEAGSTLVKALFSFNGGQILDAIKGFGKSALDALKAAVVEPFQKLFESAISNVTMQVTKFVTDKLMGLLGKAFGGIFSSLTTGLGGTAPLTAAATQLQVAATQLQAAATTLAATNGGMKIASEAAGTAAKTASTAAGSVAKSAGSVASTASTTLSKVSQISGIVTGAISAVTGVLSYLQGRRMEQDIGRIEVTSREIKAELMNFRADAHVRQAQFFEMTANVVGNIQRYGDAAGGFLSEILGTLQLAVSWLEQIHTKLGTGVTMSAGMSGAPAPDGGTTDPEAPPETGAVTGNTGAVTENTGAVTENTGATTENTGETGENTGAVEGNTVGTATNTGVTEGNTAATATATTATNSLGLAAQVAAGQLPAYAAQLESFVGKTSKDLAMYVKDAGSTLEQSMQLMNNGTQRLVRDLKTGLQYVIDVTTDKVVKIYGAQEKVIDQATGAVVDFARVTQKTTDYTQAMGTAVSSATVGIEDMAGAARYASIGLPAAVDVLTGSIVGAGAAIKDAVHDIIYPSRGPGEGGPVLGSEMPRVITSEPVNTGNIDWSAGSNITIGGRVLPQNFMSASPITLNVTVNNADAKQVANTMVTQWRSQGVDI